MKKSFTLIELLVATTIFSLVLAIFIVVVWSVLQPKSKLKAMANLREQTQQVMDTITASIEEANNTEAGSYVNFALNDNGGALVACPAASQPCSGSRLVTSANLPNNGSTVNVRKAFGIYDDASPIPNWQGGSCTGSHCYLDIVQSVNGGGLTYQRLTSDDIKVLNITFSGYDWIYSNTRDVAPYMTIIIHAESAYATAGAKPEITLKTTVRPFNTNNSTYPGANPIINEQLTY